MKDYKLRDLRASHTLGWSWNWKPCGGSGTGHLGVFAQAELLKLQKSGQFPDDKSLFALASCSKVIVYRPVLFPFLLLAPPPSSGFSVTFGTFAFSLFFSSPNNKLHLNSYLKGSHTSIHDRSRHVQSGDDENGAGADGEYDA